MAWKSSFRQNYRTTFSLTVPTYAAGISRVVADVEAPGGDKWERLKSGGKQWQATPKNLHRMQRTRPIPVAWLNSDLCPDLPKGRIPIIIIISLMHSCHISGLGSVMELKPAVRPWKLSLLSRSPWQGRSKSLMTWPHKTHDTRHTLGRFCTLQRICECCTHYSGTITIGIYVASNRHTFRCFDVSLLIY